ASHAPGAPQSVAEALRMARSAADYLNTPEAAGLDGTACGEALIALGEIQAKLAAAQVAVPAPTCPHYPERTRPSPTRTFTPFVAAPA
ncbi:MAG: hypothetical protein WBQ71_12630, partial [Trebonia sp.]